MAIDTNTPTFVERDPAVIMAESKAKLEELLGRELQPAQVEQLILNFVVFRETLLVTALTRACGKCSTSSARRRSSTTSRDWSP